MEVSNLGMTTTIEIDVYCVDLEELLIFIRVTLAPPPFLPKSEDTAF